MIAWPDIVALVLFCVVWTGLEPFLARKTARCAIPVDMLVIRRAWMREVLTRDTNFIGDAAIFGHTINSASFFASANLLIILAVGGTLFIDPSKVAAITLPVELSPDVAPWLFKLKILLILGTLVRGLSDFIWAVRQMNYCLAAIGSSPSRNENRDLDAWVEALTSVANPALHTFSKGVRSYYFVFAACLWFLGPWAFGVATIFACALLIHRHSKSEAARGLHKVRMLLDIGSENREGADR